MKSFLLSFLICTLAAANEAPRGGATIGTLEMWSTWMPADEAVNPTQVCSTVSAAYNSLNLPRGYWGQLLLPDPVDYRVRTLAGGHTEKRYYCRLKVKKFTVESGTVNLVSKK